MPRTKGSKNRPKSDIASQITEKQTQITTLTTEIEAIQKDIEGKKATLKNQGIRTEVRRERSSQARSEEGKGRC